MILTAINGLCMAIADSVPGVSGGTVAFILGFYDQFINALHGLFEKNEDTRKESRRYLFQLLLGWGPGMVASILLLSNLFTKNIYFMSSLFLGLTIVAIPFIAHSEKQLLKKQLKHIPFMLIGLAIVVGLTSLRSASGSLETINFLSLQPLHFLYIFLTGMVAISAMVLPGISGSTVLLIAGIYIPVLEAIKQLLNFNFAGLAGLITLGLGILLGIGVSIHFIRSALKNHRSQMVYLVLGLMTGSLFAIVMGPTTLAEPLPALSLSSFRLLGFLLGIAVLFGLEFLKNYRLRGEQVA